MEEWKKAFKVINGKTPTKKDCELAPSALKGELTLILSLGFHSNFTIKEETKTAGIS